MKLKQFFLTFITATCFSFSVMAQEHPDAVKVVEDTSDNVQVAQEYVQQTMTMTTDLINLLNFDFKAFAVGFAMAAGIVAVSVGEVYMNGALSNVSEEADQLQSQADQAQEAATSQQADSAPEQKVETKTIKQVEVTDSETGELLSSTLATSSLPPIVPEEIIPLLEEKQPNPAKIKEKIAELVLIDKSNPESLYVTQDLQNRLVAAGVMRALDNAKRSFELSAEAQKEIDEDRQKIESSDNFTAILGATALTTVHSYQKLNEIKGLYAQMMELDSLGSLLGSELTEEERKKRAEETESSTSAVVTPSAPAVQETPKEVSYDEFLSCAKSVLDSILDGLEERFNLSQKQQQAIEAKRAEEKLILEKRYQEFQSCVASGGEERKCFAPVVRAAVRLGGAPILRGCWSYWSLEQ